VPPRTVITAHHDLRGGRRRSYGTHPPVPAAASPSSPFTHSSATGESPGYRPRPALLGDVPRDGACSQHRSNDRWRFGLRRVVRWGPEPSLLATVISSCRNAGATSHAAGRPAFRRWLPGVLGRVACGLFDHVGDSTRVGDQRQVRGVDLRDRGVRAGGHELVCRRLDRVVGRSDHDSAGHGGPSGRPGRPQVRKVHHQARTVAGPWIIARAEFVDGK
jgi:hypothetical protein